MEEPQKFLVVIAGPTAVGKTALGIQLAKYFHSDIISADSRQMFKEMRIGTARPDKNEMQGIPHHFIDSHSIQDDYNAGKFETDVMTLLSNLFKSHAVVFLVGGSGMYIKAVTDGFDDLPDADQAVREMLRELKDEQGIEALQEMLKEKDPDYYLKVDIQNPQRLIRALEVIYSTGKPYSQFRKKIYKPRPFKVIKVGVHLDRTILYERIDRRMDEMIRNGLLDEAKKLHAYKHNNALQTVGYKEIFEFLEDRQDWLTTVALLKRNSRRYAKRQLTWFRQDTEYTWFLPSEVNKIISFLETVIKQSD